MIEVTFAQLEAWLSQFLWPFVRISSFILAAPLFGHSKVPAQVKIGFGILLTLLTAPLLPPLLQVPLLSWAGVGILTEQIIIGLAFGLVMHIVFSVVQAAGEFIGLQMGLAFATFFSADTGSNTMILSRLLYMLTLLMFLAFNGHLLMIEVFVKSFSDLPIGVGGINTDGFELLARFAVIIFKSGLLLAFPLIAALLVINLGLGILNRSAPQFTVFSVGFPVSLTIGIFLLTIMMNDLGRFLEGLFNTGLEFFGNFAAILATP